MKNSKKIVDIALYGSGDKLLEQHIKDIDLRKKPKDLNIKIELLKQTASYHKVVSLAANQINMNLRMFALLKSQFIQKGRWNNYQDIKPQNYEIVINPKLISQSNIRFKDFQQCPSIPGIRFHIWNPIHQNYQYYSAKLDETNQIKFQQKYIQLKGFQARIFDHQIRHLEGILALDLKISHSQCSVNEQYLAISAMHQKVSVLKRQLHLTSEQNMLKLMKQGKKNLASQNSQLGQHLPQKLPRKMRDILSIQYNKLKKDIN